MSTVVKVMLYGYEMHFAGLKHGNILHNKFMWLERANNMFNAIIDVIVAGYAFEQV